MAGHSQWKNRQHRKNAQDAKRGKLFMKLSKELYVAARTGGGDPETNPNLRLAVDKAKEANMPSDNVERAIKKATGDQEGVSYEAKTYEGYGPGGVAIMVHALTDNKNRTASEVRHIFSKYDGNLGEDGCVAFMFDRRGLIAMERDNSEEDEDVMLAAVEAGAEDMETDEAEYEIYTIPENFEEVRNNLSENFTISSAEVTMIPETRSHVEAEQAEQALKLIDALEDNDDVSEVYHNLDVDDDVLSNGS